MIPLPPFTIPVLIGFVALVFLVAVALVRIPDSPARHWMLFFGVALVPGIALLGGTNQALDAMKRPEFCGSCHVMGPWIRDLHDPASTTIAARHYQNRYILHDQCYTCHTEYAMFGPLRSKATGLVHFVKYVTGRWAHPIELYEPYHFSNCLHCHADSKKYVDAHTDVAEAIADGSMTCVDCHNPIHPEQEKTK